MPIYDSGNYSEEKFEQDIVEADKSVGNIKSKDIYQDKIEKDFYI